MFTGIIERLGEIRRTAAIPGGRRIRVQCKGFGSGLGPGDSIAVDGTCLTVVSRARDWFEAELSSETCKRTTLGAVRQGHGVNLERPLKASDRLGGHFVQGHVDARTVVKAVSRQADFIEMTFVLPPSLRGMLVEKGSVAVNGVSLTVSSINKSAFSVALIPHTLEVTNLSKLRRGSTVNLEVDILAKYVRALVKP
jgi:riboflavin synthase